MNPIYIYKDLTHSTFPIAIVSVWDKGFRYAPAILRDNAIEKDNEINVNGCSYYFGAMIYDSWLSRWLSLDWLMAEYPKLSPYNLVDNSPLNSIDGDGRDIIILCTNKRNRNLTGQQAIVVGNENDGWVYYSFDGFESEGKKIDKGELNSNQKEKKPENKKLELTRLKNKVR
jgi:RHS repeat-associated protein